MEKTFIIHSGERITQRKRTVWVVEPQDGGKADGSEHTCRTNAIAALIHRQQGDRYLVSFPSSPVKYILEKTKGKGWGNEWMLVTRDGEEMLRDAKLPHAIRVLLSRQPDSIDRLYISIPEGEEK